jgi:hypothetical protein
MWKRIKAKIIKWWWVYEDSYTTFLKGYTYTWSILVWRKTLKGSYKFIVNLLNKYIFKKIWWLVLKQNIIYPTATFILKSFFWIINKIDSTLSKFFLGRFILWIIKGILRFIWKWRVNFVISGIIPWSGYFLAMYILLTLIDVYGVSTVPNIHS